jgi:hypothetical protein
MYSVASVGLYGPIGGSCKNLWVPITIAGNLLLTLATIKFVSITTLVHDVEEKHLTKCSQNILLRKVKLSLSTP